VKRKIGKMLIMTENQTDSKLLVSTIDKAGYSCFTADTPDSAMNFLDNELIRIVFIDIIDHAEEKLTLIREIKEMYFMVGVVVISSKTSDQNILKAISLGADNFIIKPADWQRLPLIISSTLKQLELDSETKDYIHNLERKIDTATTTLDHSNDIVEQIFIDNIKSFVGLLEIRDFKTGRHSKRVATFSTAISEKYDIKDRVKREIEIGALLHDIGKIGLPDTIIAKTHNYFAYQDLTGTERANYERHPIIGQEAVDMVSMLSNVGSYIISDIIMSGLMVQVILTNWKVSIFLSVPELSDWLMHMIKSFSERQNQNNRKPKIYF
jgi:response regulator RpfG family c-di-GMP phosphodiesterase